MPQSLGTEIRLHWGTGGGGIAHNISSWAKGKIKMCLKEKRPKIKGKEGDWPNGRRLTDCN